MNHYREVNLGKCNKLIIVVENCFRMAVSLELIKINSYSFFSFSFINMDCLKLHKLNCCYEIEILAAATYSDASA